MLQSEEKNKLLAAYVGVVISDGDPVSGLQLLGMQLSYNSLGAWSPADPS